MQGGICEIGELRKMRRGIFIRRCIKILSTFSILKPNTRVNTPIYLLIM